MNKNSLSFLRTIMIPAALLLSLQGVSAAVELWDTSTASGLQPGDGTWDTGTTALWSSSSAGSNPLLTWVDGNDATFNATGSNAVTIGGTVVAGTVTNNLATTTTTIGGGILQLGNASVQGGLTSTGSLTINSAVTLANTTTHRFLFQTSTSSSVLTVNGNIGEASAASTVRILGSNGSTMNLNGTNTFTGGVQIHSNVASGTQTLQFNNAAALGAVSGYGVLFGQQGTYVETAVLTANLTADATIAQKLNFTSAGTGQQAVINSSGAGVATFTGAMGLGAAINGLNAGSAGDLSFRLGGSNTGNNTFQTAIVNLGSGVTTFVKQDAGKWILSGANTYTGTTSITAGTLMLSTASTNNIASSATVDVGASGTFDVSGVTGAGGFKLASGQTLKGAGTINGVLTVGSGAILAPGSSPGTLTFNNNLALSAGSTSNFEINGLTSGLYDLALGGAGSQSVAFDGTLNLIFQSGFNSNGTVKIFDFEGYGGSFVTVNTSGLASGYSATFDATTGIVTVVPEPGTWALMGLGFGFMLWRAGTRRHPKAV